MTTTIAYPDNAELTVFTRDELGWLPWIEPLPEDELTERHFEGLVDKARARSDYFRLLVRDPDVLSARTRTDKDIFYNTAGGLPRADREIAATLVSRVNGCIFCASVHARFAAHHSKDDESVDRLLADGIGAPDLPERWDAIAKASAALTRTPSFFGDAEIERLRDAGLEDAEIADTIFAAAFFNWANRLMLSLGEPEPAKG